ncbi:hypothetical protein ACFP1I_06435 [Dyadobacter subterraneus]|uniref:DUF2383 domain-containing protein n=1 Tax=Dyadobacter subterraneus TaxID=2773304 RepID=A0ABR9WFF7_9BACT|nr:hypothetical protein [Dyadobacter subterraneus]MBE9464233.1 hypothetical protein [Dyadobacter subterraneus]
MENLSLSSNIAKLWNTHQQRENLYKQTMTLDDLGPLRKLCSQGYMVSLLFKKEINWIYDQIKCTLSEGDISKGIANYNLPNLVISSDNQMLVTKMLLEQEDKTIKLYKSLLSERDITYDAKLILIEHLEKLNDIYLFLKREVSKSQVKLPVMIQAVA